MNRKSVMVPAEVAMAVTTRRVQLLAPLRRRIEQGETVSKEDALALLDLVRDAINEASADDERRKTLVNGMQSLRGTFKGTITQIDDLVAAFEGREVIEADEDEDDR